jgi:hypothetical protein
LANCSWQHGSLARGKQKISRQVIGGGAAALNSTLLSFSLFPFFEPESFDQIFSRFHMQTFKPSRTKLVAGT